MNKLILSVSPMLEKELSALARCIQVSTEFVQLLEEWQKQVPLIIWNFGKKTSIAEFIQEVGNLIPSFCETRDQNNVSDSFGDIDNETSLEQFTAWAKEKLADEGSGVSVGGKRIPLKREVLIEMVELPQPLTSDLVNQFREVYAFLPSSKLNRSRVRSREGWRSEPPKDFLQFISIDKSKIVVDPGAEKSLQEQFTVFASSSQLKVWDRLQKIREELISVQNETGIQFGDFIQELGKPSILVADRV